MPRNRKLPRLRVQLRDLPTHQILETHSETHKTPFLLSLLKKLEVYFVFYFFHDLLAVGLGNVVHVDLGLNLFTLNHSLVFIELEVEVEHILHDVDEEDETQHN